VNESIKVAGIVLILLFATRLDRNELRWVMRLYLAAIGVCVLYSCSQTAAAYVWNVDLDQIAMQQLPRWVMEPVSMERNVVGVSFGTLKLYRLSGLSGDPNLNAITLVMALPIMFVLAEGRGSAPVFLLILGSIVFVGLSLSNAGAGVAVVVLAVSSVGYLKRRGWLIVATWISVFAVATYLWMNEAEVLREVLEFKLDPFGTIASHGDIAAAAIDVWLKHPFGVGLNGFAVYSEAFSAHNSYLGLLAELGPIGVLVTLATLGFCAKTCVATGSDLGRAGALSIAAMALSGLGLDVLHRFEFEVVMCLVFAVAVEEGRRAVVSTEAVASARFRGGPRTAIQVAK
jgi:hypothetical protein